LDFPVNNIHEDGLILIDKPLKLTSFGAVKKVRYLLKGKKTGHAGTLDPLASGLVILCTGKATKIIEGIQAQTKVYEGKIFLGATTPSFDLETEPVFTSSTHIPSSEEIIAAAKSFEGEIDQVPPIYSAIKVGGERAYNFAREGKELELKSRKINVYSFAITEINYPLVSFNIECSKGTYIRTLANDLGHKLGVGGYLAELRRTKIGEYDVMHAFTLEAFEEKVKNESF
jgi:tRNA pseudouridine55 synthase